MESAHQPGQSDHDAPLGSLVVAVLTFKRPGDLPELLPQLVEHCATVADVTGGASVLVVDNDPEASAREVVEGLRLPQVRYVVEPKPGIAAARNRALAEAHGAHLLVFIDDDERPYENWLSSLVECYRRERSAAVAGAVVPDVGLIDDPWIKAGGFFVRKRYPTGTPQEAAATGNLLLDLHQVEGLGQVRFDERFGLTGGSDTVFTRTLTARGGRIVWCDESVVVDHIRIQRLTREWLLRRFYRFGNGWARSSLLLTDGGWARFVMRLRLTLQGVLRVLVGSTRTLYGRLTGSLRHQARGSRMSSRGRGLVTGAWGSVYTEYRRKAVVPEGAARAA